MSVDLVGFSTFDGRLSGVVKKMRQSGNRRVAVGILKTADDDLKLIAAVNEFGSSDGRIPSRPAFRMAVRDSRLRLFTREQMTQYWRSNITLPQALTAIGDFGVKMVQTYIGSNIQPPNATSTIKRKGSARTLIDTGRYQRSIAWYFI